MVERVRRVKVRKLVGWDKDRLVGKAKAVCTGKQNKEFIQHIPSASRCSAISRGIMVIWEDKQHHSEHPFPSFLFPQFCRLSMIPRGMGYPFGHLGQPSHPDMLPTSCALPDSFLMGWQEEQKRPLLCISSVWKSWKYLFVINAVFSTNPKHYPSLASIKKTNSIPAKTGTDY